MFLERQYAIEHTVLRLRGRFFDFAVNVYIALFIDASQNARTLRISVVRNPFPFELDNGEILGVDLVISQLLVTVFPARPGR